MLTNQYLWFYLQKAGIKHESRESRMQQLFKCSKLLFKLSLQISLLQPHLKSSSKAFSLFVCYTNHSACVYLPCDQKPKRQTFHIWFSNTIFLISLFMSSMFSDFLLTKISQDWGETERKKSIEAHVLLVSKCCRTFAAMSTIINIALTWWLNDNNTEPHQLRCQRVVGPHPSLHAAWTLMVVRLSAHLSDEQKYKHLTKYSKLSLRQCLRDNVWHLSTPSQRRL